MPPPPSYAFPWAIFGRKWIAQKALKPKPVVPIFFLQVLKVPREKEFSLWVGRDWIQETTPKNLVLPLNYEFQVNPHPWLSLLGLKTKVCQKKFLGLFEISGFPDNPKHGMTLSRLKKKIFKNDELIILKNITVICSASVKFIR